MTMRFITPILLCTFLLLVLRLSAQTTHEALQSEFEIKTRMIEGSITIDGDLSEPTWKSAQVASNFWMKWPRDGEQQKQRTEVRIAYDAHFLYIGAFCEDSGKNIIASLKRDIGYFESDGIGIVLDPYNKSQSGYFFCVNAVGVQSDGLLIPIGDEQVDFNWDNKWRAEVRQQVNGWSAEFAIPLSILKFQAGQTDWGINFVRNDASGGLFYTWTKMPLQFNGIDIGWTGKLRFEEAPNKPSGYYALIPYVNTAGSRDYESDGKWDKTAAVGLDAKIGLGSKMNLDLTLNPDFSQVEVDEQVINLTRFDISLPEKRGFFLENADVIGGFGFPLARPFFSRKIGLNDDGSRVPILAGARLTGNLDNDTRLGFMDIQTRTQDTLTGQNYSAIALHRRIFGRTKVSGYFLNRQAMNKLEVVARDYCRNAGFQFDFTSNDGKWGAWATHHQSFKYGIKGQNTWGDYGFMYNNRRITAIFDLLNMGKNHYVDMGFEGRVQNYDAISGEIIRIGYNFMFIKFDYKLFPKRKNPVLNFSSPGIETFTVYNPDGTFNENNINLNYKLDFRNTQQIVANFNYIKANVPVSFAFGEGADCVPLPKGLYEFTNANLTWNSDARKALFWEAKATVGGFYNGKQYSFSFQPKLRAQPWGNFALKFEYNLLDFPDPYCDAKLLAISPKMEIFFNKSLYWTTYLQYNTQYNNFNINSRVQWRYRPMSDVFLVYTDNYDTATQVLKVKNKAVVLKVSYWL